MKAYKLVRQCLPAGKAGFGFQYSQSHKFALLILCSILLHSNLAFAQNDNQIYAMAIREAKAGNMDFAFMHFRSLLRNYPDSKYAHDALFATGEYYFIAGDYNNTIEALSNFINDYPDSEGLPFALLYLLKAAEIRRQEPLAEKLKNKIISLKRLSFLFRESEGYTYKSPLRIKYRVIYYIDKVEFHVDDKLSEKISY